MAFNKYMHPRNPFKERKPDFKALAIKYPHFRSQVTQDITGKVHLNFKNPEALKALTECTLKEEFNLDVELPVERLIPTLPLRLNYILWLDDIIGEQSKEILGIDIGAGSACIYPLLGSKVKGWKFVATEIDDLNFTHAKQNVSRNNLEDKINVIKVEKGSLLLDVLDKVGIDSQYDFCMCNPPFFGSTLEAEGTITTKNSHRPGPKSISTACASESIVVGGEEDFVKHLVDESLKLMEKIRIYTSMLGKKSSVACITKYFHIKQIKNFSSTEFCQGNTMRWGIAWTFDEMIIFPKPLFTCKSKEKQPLVHLVPSGCLELPEYTLRACVTYMKQTLEQLEIPFVKVRSLPEETGLRLCPSSNTWANQRRKRRENEQKQLAASSHEKKYCSEESDLATIISKPAVVKPTEHDSLTIISGSSAGLIPTKIDRKRKRIKNVESNHDDSVNKRNKTLEWESSTSISESSACSTNTGHSRKANENSESTHDEIINKKDKLAHSSRDLSDSTLLDVSSPSSLFKCYLNVKKTDCSVVLEMRWIEGSRELMYDLMQYFKNRLK